MFDEQEIIEFFNRIINAPELKNQEIKINVTKFYEYLVLTKMCNDETLAKLSKITTCLNEIITIRNTIGYIDINTLLQEPEQPRKLAKKPQKNKHYIHYESSDSSSSCGTTARYTSRC